MGSFGDVYLALTSFPIISDTEITKTDTGTAATNPVQLVAIKHFRNTTQCHSVITELRILNKCSNCDGVARAIDFVIGEHSTMVVLQYQPSISFREKCSERFWTVANIRPYMTSLLTSVAQIHSIGIIHRDIKPDNFLYDPTSHAGKLIDFGLAMDMEVRDTRPPRPIGERVPGMVQVGTNAPCTPKKMGAAGTAGFRAPEILLGADTTHQVTYPIDLWSCGVVLLMMLTQRTSLLRLRQGNPIPDPIFDGGPPGEPIAELLIIRALVGDGPFQEGMQALGISFAMSQKAMQYPIPTDTLPRLLEAHSDVLDECPEAGELCQLLLSVNPADRPTAEEALKHPFITGAG